MPDLSRISGAELLFDRQECFNDIVTCLSAQANNITDYSEGTVEDRLMKNLQMIDTIMKECKRRGFDPAQFDHVEKRRKSNE